ncbi:hypothetical protein CUJ83_04735 [Methanocella sp. CWC-04]|uniref:Lipoprotein n=1 Tax=Methanooceanicella nereidis TaxID=2052831 RepID=A0AAP2RBD1_9EURY|nr:hypothetical protein [Methanocella sp. CWC-04]MCD1294303.1 hypothetical protein [Methanocella sp. CWC-04]
MKDMKKILMLALILSVVVAFSGCICCCGLDGMLSKFKKSVTEISFPSEITIGGKTYKKVYTNEYIGSSAVKSQVKRLLPKLGYSGSEFLDPVDSFVDMTGITEYKSFKYAGSGPTQVVAGFVGKVSSPLTATANYESVKQIVNSGLSMANDPGQNPGGVQDISYEGGLGVGDGGDKYKAKLFGQDCYVVVTKYSNMFVSTYSLESFEAAKSAVEMAIAQIDKAA